MTLFRRKLVLISLCVGPAFVACGKTSDSELAVVAGGPTAGTAGKVGGSAQVEIGGIGSLSPDDDGGGGMSASASVGCAQAGADNAGAAGATEECSSPPPSVCADGTHLIYYSSAGCVAHVCKWTASTLDCADICANGACVTSFTAK